MKKGNRQLLPVWGYVLLNLAFLGVMTAIYFFAVDYASKHNFRSVGLFPVLLTCYLSFSAVCIFDAMYDRLSSGTKPALPRTDPTAPSPKEKRGKGDRD